MSGLLNEKMVKIFGANWRTTLFGGGALLFGGLSTQPELFSFLTPEHCLWATGFCKLMAFILGTLFVVVTKDAAVTGGTVAATLEAGKRVDEEKALKTIALNEVKK